tara:strand:- start:11 stop:313 length:303 start_codon:yes stop_codon:yes gene_type:complete
MKTLKIDFRISYEVQLTLKGLSFKKLKGTSIGRDLIISDLRKYALPYHDYEGLDVTTANIELNFLVSALKEIKSVINFDKIKTVGYYELDGEELMKEVVN